MSRTTKRADGSTDDHNVTPFRDINADTTQRRIAEELIAARLAKGVDVADIAKVLHIRREYLQALEDGRFEDLPGPTYVAGFLRTYGKHLGLDSEELVRMYKDESGGVLARQNLYFPVAASETRRPTGGMIAAALLIAVIALAAWYAIGERDLVDLDLIPPVPDFLAETSSEDGAALAAVGDEASAEPESVEAIVVENVDVDTEAEEIGAGEPLVQNPPEVTIARETVTNSAGDDLSAAATGVVDNAVVPAEADLDAEVAAVEASVPPDPDTAGDLVAGDVAGEAAEDVEAADDVANNDGEGYVPRVYGRTNADSRVEIRASETSWVQIEAPGNQILLTRVLEPGDIYRVPNGGQIVLNTGNAGGLELRVDGQLIAPLGERGAVIKDVLLEPDSLLQR